MKRFVFFLALGVASGHSFGSVLFFNSASFAGNGAMRSSWLTAAGITGGQYFVDFESYAVGTNLNGVDLGGGAALSHPTSTALVQSSASFFGSSNPIDTKALSLGETSGTITLNFATPVDYIGGYDIDQPGATVRATLTDNSTISFSWDSTGSSGNSAEFWGLWRNDAAAISKVEFVATNGGDGEWGLDNLEYGAVPEPGTMIVVGAGLALTQLRRRRR